MSEQHIYRGTGSPYDTGVVAPAGSHYIDDDRFDRVWIATGHFVENGEESTEWVMLEPAIAIFEAGASTYGYDFAAGVPTHILMGAGTGINFTNVGAGQTVRSNVELEKVAADTLRYVGDQAYIARIDPVSANVLALMVTPVNTYSV